MLPIRIAPKGLVRRFLGLSLMLFLGGVVLGPSDAGPLPPVGVDDFRTLIDSKRAPEPRPPVAGQTLAEYRRRLRQAADELPSLGEVSRVLLMTEWSSGEFDLESAVSPVPLDQVEQAVRQAKDEDFKRDVQKMMDAHADDWAGVNRAIVAEIKHEVRLDLLKRLETRSRFYLSEGRVVDRVAAANLISDTMSTSRRQDVSQYRTPGGGFLPGVMATQPTDVTKSSDSLRQRMRTLSGDLAKLVEHPDTQVRVAGIRALSDLEREPGDLVSLLKPILTSQQSDAPTRQAAAEALEHILDVYTAPQMNKNRPLPYLRAVEQVLPVAAEGLTDSAPLVRRASLEACQRAALILEDLASSERRTVFRPTLLAVDKILPKINVVARDRVPELRVGASHVLETFALSIQRMNYKGPALPAPDIEPNKPMPQLNPESSRGKKQTSITPYRSASEDAPVVTLERPIKLPDRSVAQSQRANASRSASERSLIQLAAFQAQPLDQLPPPILVPKEDAGIQETVRSMIDNLKHPDYRVRLAAVDTLETFGKQAETAIPALVAALRDYNKFVRWSAARTLGRLNPHREDEVVPGLMRLLGDHEDPSVRIAAAKALELYGEHAKKAVPLLARVINRGDKEYILAILTTIQGIGTDAAPALPNVAWILSDKSQPPSVRKEAANTLGRFGALAKDQLPVLREVMNTDLDEEVRNAASMAVLAVERPEK